MYAGCMLSLFVTSCLFAQYIWGDPVLITSHPTAQIWDQNLFIDIHGGLHVVWNEVYEDNLSQIFYSKSVDTGDTWSVPFNVSQSDTSKLARPAVGTDYNGNVYVSYTWNSLGYPILLQKKYDGISWSEPARLDSNSYQFRNWYLNDNEGRTYHFWRQLTYTKYRYKEKNSTEWSEFNYSIHDLSVNDMKIDGENNLHAVGTKILVLGEDHRSMYIKYDKQTDKWTDYYELDKDYSSGALIDVSEDRNIHVVYSERNFNQTDFITFYKKKEVSDSLWSSTELVTELENLSLHYMTSRNNNPEFLLQTGTLDAKMSEFLKWNNSWSLYNYYFDDIHYIGDPVFKEKSGILNMCFRIYVYNSTDFLYFMKTTGTGIENNYLSTADIMLYQNYPNPFNNETIIQFGIDKVSEVELSIFNLKGELVQNIISRKLDKGNHSCSFNADNLNSGIYYYRLSVDGIKKETKRMLFLK